MRERLTKARTQEIAPKPSAPLPTQADVQRRIAEAAYYRAEQRGFQPGFEHEDWLAAEAEIAQRRAR
jgi:hypothetical protein